MLDDRLASLVGSTSKYLKKAIQARELFYRGQDEAGASYGDPKLRQDARYRFAESVQAKQFIADNKWHMSQSRTFALASIARAAYLILGELRELNKHQERHQQALREIKNAIRGSRNS